jgi:CRISPR/Cas system-associated exonuclease Cas4 (RecB family)
LKEHNKTDQQLNRESSPINNSVKKYPVQDGTNFSEGTERVIEQSKGQTTKSRKRANTGLDLGEYYISRAIDTLEEWYSKPRDGYHVSDVTLCPRQRVFQKIDPRPIGAKTVSIYAAGRAIHEAIQSLFISDKRTFEREKHIEYQDTQGSIDIYDRKRNIPLELKSSRSRKTKEPKSFHVEQLKYYISMLGANQGYILYQNLLHFGETPFQAFRITLNAQERDEQRNKLVKEVSSLKRAVIAADPSLARGVSEDPELNWLCRDCPYLIECKGIQKAIIAS